MEDLKLPRSLNKVEIQALLPQTGFALFLDSCEIHNGKTDGEIEAIGSFTFPEDHPMVRDHFGVVRGVDVVECCGQAGIPIISLSSKFEGLKPMFTGFDKFKIRNNVFPGQEIISRVVINPSTVSLHHGAYFGTAWAVATVNNIVVARGYLEFVIGKLKDMPRNGE